MRGWDRTSLKGAVKRKAFWFRYCLCLAQILVIVAYFLPWFDGRYSIDEGPVIWVSKIATPVPDHILPAFIAIIFGFAAALSSLVLVEGSCLFRPNSVRMFQAASLLNGLAIACALLYPPGWYPAYWPDVWDAVMHAGIGWYMALIFGFGASILALLTYNEIDKSAESRSIPEGISLRRYRESPSSWAVMFLVVAGVALVLRGFFLVWGSGTIHILNSFRTWSSSGVESSPAMSLVPIAALSVLTVLVIDQVLTDRRMGLPRLAASSAFATAFALILLWGYATYEQQWSTGDPYGFYSSIVQLHYGWYLCVAGELIIALGLLLRLILIGREKRKNDDMKEPGLQASVESS